ncbi:hypothetical protein Q9290_10185 [Oceanimonas sp. CHS3-5]|nr:hypothetical protein [Oceanimonas sp. CHS3-5]
MAGTGLNRGRVAIALVLLVGVLCLGQRIGLMDHCGQQAQVEQPHDTAGTADSEGCSLSEQLLTKFWDHADSLLLGLIALLCWWLAPAGRPGRRPVPPPEPVPEQRRHLVLCVFRE